MANVTKLSASNYIMWSRQIHALFDGYDLASFLDGSKPIPDPVITTDEQTVTNHVHVLHTRQDKLIYSAILDAVSLPIQYLLSRANTTEEVWSTLASIYAKPSRGHINQLKYKLKQWKKGIKTIDEYLQGLTTRVDQLALLGKVLDLEDQIEYTLDGLPEEYKQIVDQVESCDHPPTLSELHEKLLNHEAKLLATQVQSPLRISANVATNIFHPNQRHNSNKSQPWQPSQNNTSNQYHSPKLYLGRCQLCGLQGYSARRCNQLTQQNGLQQPFTLWKPQANLAGMMHPTSPWLLDSGATHHISSDLANLSLHQQYNGGEEVIVGNGSGLPISHKGSTLLPSSNRSLKLTDVLCVPQIQKNLISIYKLCNTNQVYVLFFPSCFKVRDLKTGDLLLEGRTMNELYEWHVSLPIASTHHTAITNLKTTSTDWHARLGHPSHPILKTIISKFSLPLSTTLSQSSVCNDCLLNKTRKLVFSQSTITSTRPLEYLFSDLWTSPILSNENHKYYLVIVDHFTRYIPGFIHSSKNPKPKKLSSVSQPLLKTNFKPKTLPYSLTMVVNSSPSNHS